MGNTYSIDKSVPPAGALLFVQDTGCCITPNFSESKPANMPMISDAAWQTFHSKVGTAASKLWSEKIQLIALVLLPIMFVPVLLPGVFGRDREEGSGGMGLVGIHLILPIVMLGGFFAPRWWAIQQNKVQDQVIRLACDELATATGISVQYRTQFTGFCKPKHAQPFRAIAITPNSEGLSVGAGGSQLMSVMVPKGCSTGSALQIQTPQGQTVQVIVPQGYAAGQTFQVQVPAAAPVIVMGTIVAQP